tara:strand:- start:1540 stop:2571 length:1032 start_codon:yes stop_codon:yes gene_type:complete
LKNWRKISVKSDTKISKAIEIINLYGSKLVLVIDNQDKLIGILNDGDIRRAILKKIDFNNPVSEVMTKNPIKGIKGSSREQILSLMRYNEIYQLPITDENSRLIEIISLEELIGIKKKNNPVVIMAGGRGKRLKPLTDNVPKPMLILKDKPILQTILETFIDQGFYKFYFSVNYKSNVIKKYFGDGSKWKAEISYLEEKDELGTAGSLSLIKDKIEDTFLVMNGDLITKPDYGKILISHKKNNSIATIVVNENEFKIPYGVLNLENNKVISFVEKPIQRYFVNAGIYAFSPEILKYLKKQTYLDMPNLFNKLINKKKNIDAYILNDIWFDIGSLPDFEKAQKE